MNRQAHLIIGIALFLAYAYGAGLFHSTSPESFACGIIAVAAGSILPDILEPPTGARHRGTCHSRRALKFVAVIFLVAAVTVLYTLDIPRFQLVFGTSCFFLGYMAHLLADSFTRAGLPG